MKEKRKLDEAKRKYNVTKTYSVIHQKKYVRNTR